MPWPAPAVPEDIPHGGMPGDKVCIGGTQIQKASVVFDAIRPMIAQAMEESACGRCVISVCGGSGVERAKRRR